MIVALAAMDRARKVDPMILKRLTIIIPREAWALAPPSRPMITKRPSETANAKNYFFDRYGVPWITYETGDDTDPTWIANAAPVFAEEMMRVLFGGSSP